MGVSVPSNPKDSAIKPLHFGYRSGDLKLNTHKYSDKLTPYWNHDILNPGSKQKFGRYVSEHSDEKHLKEYGKKYGKRYGRQGLTAL